MSCAVMCGGGGGGNAMPNLRTHTATRPSTAQTINHRPADLSSTKGPRSQSQRPRHPQCPAKPKSSTGGVAGALQCVVRSVHVWSSQRSPRPPSHLHLHQKPARNTPVATVPLPLFAYCTLGVGLWPTVCPPCSQSKAGHCGGALNTQRRQGGAGHVKVYREMVKMLNKGGLYEWQIP